MKPYVSPIFKSKQRFDRSKESALENLTHETARERIKKAQFVHYSVEYKDFIRHPDKAQRVKGKENDIFFQKLTSELNEDEIFKENGKLPSNWSRLGKPGRQGTTLKVETKGRSYALKFVKEKIGNGVDEYTYEGENGIMYKISTVQQSDGPLGSNEQYIHTGATLLLQARIQQLAADATCSCPVYAVVQLHDNLSFIAMPVMKQRFVDRYRALNKVVSEKHQLQLWNIYLKLDSAGILHNDSNCLNVMLDPDDNIILIDFDRSRLLIKKDIKKYGLYPNLIFLAYLHCKNSMKYDAILNAARLLDREGKWDRQPYRLSFEEETKCEANLLPTYLKWGYSQIYIYADEFNPPLQFLEIIRVKRKANLELGCPIQLRF